MDTVIHETPDWALLIHAAVVLVVVLGMLGLSFLLGQRHNERATSQPYEGGIVGAGSARLRFPAHFYLVAMLFVIFDLETVFLFAWAVSAREVGWFGYLEAFGFTAMLALGLVYLWRVGALEWGHGARDHRDTPRAASGDAL